MAFIFPFRQFTVVGKPLGTITYGNDRQINIASNRMLGAYTRNGQYFITFQDDNDELSTAQVVENITASPFLRAFTVLYEVSTIRLTLGPASIYYVNPDAVFKVLNYTDTKNPTVLGEISILGPHNLKAKIRLGITGTAALTLLAS